jgi:hypothetical protein
MGIFGQGGKKKKNQRSAPRPQKSSKDLVEKRWQGMLRTNQSLAEKVALKEHGCSDLITDASKESSERIRSKAFGALEKVIDENPEQLTPFLGPILSSAMGVKAPPNYNRIYPPDENEINDAGPDDLDRMIDHLDKIEQLKERYGMGKGGGGALGQLLSPDVVTAALGVVAAILGNKQQAAPTLTEITAPGGGNQTLLPAAATPAADSADNNNHNNQQIYIIETADGQLRMTEQQYRNYIARKTATEVKRPEPVKAPTVESTQSPKPAAADSTADAAARGENEMKKPTTPVNSDAIPDASSYVLDTSSTGEFDEDFKKGSIGIAKWQQWTSQTPEEFVDTCQVAADEGEGDIAFLLFTLTTCKKAEDFLKQLEPLRDHPQYGPVIQSLKPTWLQEVIDYLHLQQEGG